MTSSNKPLTQSYSSQALNTLNQQLGQTATSGITSAGTNTYPVASSAYSWPQGITMEPCYPVDYNLPLNVKLKDGTIKSFPWIDVMRSLGVEW